jgi:hypothetical protein
MEDSMKQQNNFEYQKIIRRRNKKEFCVGDIVKWETPTCANMRRYIKTCKIDHGEGPFIVRKIQKVQYSVQKTVGHHQHVWLENIEKSKFSGVLLKIVTKKKHTR